MYNGHDSLYDCDLKTKNNGRKMHALFHVVNSYPVVPVLPILN